MAEGPPVGRQVEMDEVEMVDVSSSFTEEMVISHSQVELLDSNKDHLLDAYDVEIAYGLIVFESGEKKQWVHLKGQTEDLKEAKDYVRALCNPEEILPIRYPPELHDVLITTNVHARLEKQSRTAIIYPKVGEAKVQGLDPLAVTLAFSAIEDLVARYEQEVYAEHADDSPSPMSKQSTSRLDRELKRLSSKDDTIVYEDDYSTVPNAVKRTILGWFYEAQASDETDDGPRQTNQAQPKEPVHIEEAVTIDLTASPRPTSPLTLPPPTHTPAPDAGSLLLQAIMTSASREHSPVVRNSNTGTGTPQRQTNMEDVAKKLEFVERGRNAMETDVSQDTEASQPFTSHQSSQGAVAGPSGRSRSPPKPSINLDVSEEGMKLIKLGREQGFADEEITEVFSSWGDLLHSSEFISVLQQNRKIHGFQTNLPQSPAVAGPSQPPTAGSGLEKEKHPIEALITKYSPSVKHKSDTDSAKKGGVSTETAAPKEGLFNEYFEQLSRDYVEESETHSLQDLRERNAERRRLLQQAFEKQRSPVAATAGARVEPSTPEGAVGGASATVASPPMDTLDDFSLPYAAANAAGEQRRLASRSVQKNEPCTNHATYNVQHADSRSRSPRGRRGSPQRALVNNENFSGSPRRKQQYTGPVMVGGQMNSGGAHGHVGMPAPTISPRSNLRYIVIDGSNVAMAHGNNQVFSCRGIEICVEYFRKRGHTEITAFVPQWRTRTGVEVQSNPISDQNILHDLRKRGYLVFTPARRVPGKNIVCYDDKFVLRLCEETDGIMVSNDNYRDLWQEKREWRKLIEERLLMFSFVGDIFMPPDDPLGRNGPMLNEFLKKNPSNANDRYSNRAGDRQNWNKRQRTNGGGKQPYQQQGTWGYNQQPFNFQQGYGQGGFNRGGQNYNRPQFQGQPWNQQDRNAANFQYPHPTRQPMPPHQTRQPAPAQQQNNPPKQQKRQQSATDWLVKKLTSVFPDNRDLVIRVLDNHPAEKDLNKLSTYVLEASGTGDS